MKSQKKQITKIIIYAVMLVVFLVITGVIYGWEELQLLVNFDLAVIIKLAIMICFILVVGNSIKLVLSIIKTENKRANTIIGLILSFMKYLLAIVIICWGLAILGVDIGTIFASVGLLTLIVGFSAESLIADLITGLFMIFENQYNVGDIIEVDGFRGKVKSIGIRTTSIVDTGENAKIINNSAMVNILNRSMDVSKAVCDLSIPYEADLVEVENKLPEILQKIYDENEGVIKELPKYVGVQSLGESAVILRIVAGVDEKEIYNVTRILNRELYLAMKEMNINIPYRQLDIHTK